MAKKVNKKNKKKIKKEESSEKEQESLKENINNKLEPSMNYKHFNIQKLSKVIDKELIQNLLSPPKNIEIKKEKNDDIIEKTDESQYKKLQNNYLKNNLNINIISLITQLINTSETIPKELKNNYPINNILLDIVKELMFTDLEIVYYSLYLDNFGWTNEYYDVKDNLIITGLSVKKYLNKNIDVIENHLNKKYEMIKEKFQNWINTQDDIKKNITITPMMVNERNNLLKKPFNCYCRNNFIDYNDAVDKILQLSLPYNEINKHSKKNNNSKKTNNELVNLTNGLEDNNDFELFKNTQQNNNINFVKFNNINSFNNQNNNNIIYNSLSLKDSNNFQNNYNNLFIPKTKKTIEKKESDKIIQNDEFNELISKDFSFQPFIMKSSDISFQIKPSHSFLYN